MTPSAATTRPPARTATFASTASTVVALLAIASAARLVPVGEVLVVHESRPAVRESAVLRAVAVAVAAAKDLLAVDQTTTNAFDIAGPAAVGIARPILAAAPAQPFRSAPLASLDERLLDLPPPTA